MPSIFDEDIRNDMNGIGWNPFNTDESATLNSSKVSFYRGVPVFRTAAGGRSGLSWQEPSSSSSSSWVNGVPDG